MSSAHINGRRNRIVANALWSLHYGICGRCGKPIDPELHFTHPHSLTIGHVIPLSLGGTNVLENMRPEHRRCNLAAGNRETAAVSTPILP